ncbi:MAG: MFS transporter [Gammaproteobacteria bacterium]|nr:MFS transporter [Gammaproteobacteria bacterium]
MNPLRLYLFGTGSWFLAYGIQTVTFAWLVTMVLRESPEMVGVAQMTMLIPTMLFILVGGSLADHLGGRRMTIIAQSVAVLPPLFLLAALWADALTFRIIILYAIVMGLAQAFVTPARDRLLAQVAEGRIQRTVVLANMTQFGVQMVGFVIASFAEAVGPVPILATQALILAIGVITFTRVIAGPAAPMVAERRMVRDMLASIREGYRTVAASRAMRMVFLQNCAMGLFFMGAYVVTLPLLVREVYDGTSSDLAWMNAFNALGLVTTIVILMRFGDIRKQGRALLVSQALASVVLVIAGLAGVSFTVFVSLVFVWGMCGGITMSMARTIMLEAAPEDQRGRVMSFFSFSFMGAGPLGALGNGFLVDWVGAEMALVTTATLMLVTILIIMVSSQLWRFEGPLHTV